MPQPYLLIDGYNLMHAVGMARRQYGPGDLERCRNRFLGYLVSHLTPRERGRTTIVFDAREAPADAARGFTLEQMEVRFAEPGGDADSLVEDLIAHHSAPRQVRVISSDRRLQRAARRRRATSISSEDFATGLTERGPVRHRRQAERTDRDLQAKRSGESAPEEIEAWLQVFGDVEATIERTLEPEIATEPSVSRASDQSTKGGDPRDRAIRKPQPPASDEPADAPGLPIGEDELRMWQARVDELAEGREGWPTEPEH